MVNLIVFFLLFILPFIVAPFGITEFENPKVIIGELAVILLFIQFMLSRSIKNEFNSKKLFLFFALFLLTLIHMVFIKSHLMFLGNLIRMQGIFLLWFLLLFSILSENYSIGHIPKHVYFFLLVAELIMTYFLSVNESNRYIGTLGEPNATAAFIIFLWPFLFFSKKDSGYQNIVENIFAFLIVGSILFLTNSRSAMIAFAIQMIFIILRRTNLSSIRSTIICICLYLTSYLLPFFDSSIYESRVQIWQSALWANGNSILFGRGFGNMEKYLHESAKNLGLLVQNSAFDSAHNIFLDWWVQGGIVGLIILLSLIFFSVKKFAKEDNERGLVLLLGMITVLSFNPASIVGLFSFWWLIGQGTKNYSQNQPS